MDQRDVWNALAPEWRRLRPRPNEDVVDFIRNSKGLILDAGCGTGRNLIAGRKYIAFDFAEKQAEFALKKAEAEQIDASVIMANASDMPFRDCSFDAVLLSNVLHTMKAEEREKCLREVVRVLKPGATAFISVWNKRQPRFFLRPKEDEIPWKTSNAPVMRYYYFFTKGELRKAIEKSGLEVLRIYSSRKKALKLFPMDIIAVCRKAGVPKATFPKSCIKRKSWGNLV